MDAVFAALGQQVVRFRYAVIGAWIIAIIVVVHWFPTIASVSNSQTSSFLPKSSPSIQAQNLESSFQSANLASMTLVAGRPGTKLTAADQTAITRTEDRIRSLPHVTSLQDLGVSPDGEARQATIQAAVPPYGGGTANTLVVQIRSLFPRSAQPSGLAFHLTGSLPTTYDTQLQESKSNDLANLLSYLVVIILLLLTFRAALVPVITVITAGMALFLGQYVIAESTHLGVQVSQVTAAVLIVLVIGAGTDYSVFLLSRMREEMAAGVPPQAAVSRALARVGESISFSAFTVIAALMSLLLAQFGVYQSLGPPLAIGIAVMLLGGLTLLPALLAILGARTFWPSHIQHTTSPHAGAWGTIAERVLSRPVLTLILGIVLFAGLALGSIGSSTAGFASQNGAPVGSDSEVGQVVLQDHFPGAGLNPEFALFTFRTSVWNNPAPVLQAQQNLISSRSFQSVAGPFQPHGLTPAQLVTLHRTLGPPQALPPQQSANVKISPIVYNAYRALAQFISTDGRTVQILTIPTNNDLADTHAIEAIPALRRTVTSVSQHVGAVSSGVFGVLAYAYDIDQVSASDLQRIIPIVALLIAVLLAVVVRSVVAPVYLVVSVVLSYLAALGLAAIIFVHLGGQSGLNFVLPFVMFIFLMALGSDYNILVMARIREEAQRLPIRDAVRTAIGATGTTVTTAGIILGGTFAALGIAAPHGAAGDQVRQIGYGIAAGILMDTFLVRTLLVPSVVVLLGRWNWWPSGLSRRRASVPEVDSV